MRIRQAGKTRMIGTIGRSIAAARAAFQRSLRVESLEGRWLMAADLAGALDIQTAEVATWWSNADHLGGQALSSGNGTSQQKDGALAGSMQGEGEANQDLVGFAKALTNAGVKFYGAAWCPMCNSQKALFDDGAKFLPFIEVTNPDRTPNQIATDNNITAYPTWTFANGTRVTGYQTLSQLSSLSGVPIPGSMNPSFATIGNQVVLIGSPLHIPVDAYDPNGDPLTVTVTTSDPTLLTAEVLSGGRSARMETETYGTMVFRLFEPEVPLPTGRFIQLSESGFYNMTNSGQIIFHRVIDNFVIQGGDPTGTGSGGSTLGDFDDQYDVDLQHNRTGVISFAKAGDDTNDSQFFITEGPQRNLDFNHSVFGQLIEGDATREAISKVPVGANDKPTTPVVINKVSIFQDSENGLVRLKAVGGRTGTSSVTVRVADGEGNFVEETFSVSVQNDTKNSAPFLNPITIPARVPGQPVVIQLSSQDVEGDPVYYDAVIPTGAPYPMTVNNQTGVVTLTPNAGYSGSMSVTVGVRALNGADTVDTFDTQVLVIPALTNAPTGVVLLATSDTGFSNSDRITNAGTLEFDVSGTVSGAVVELRVGTSVVGTATATGSTTRVTTNNFAALGDGTYEVVATQKVGDVGSSASPSISIIYDKTVPAVLPVSSFPSSQTVGVGLNVNLTHPEEGPGFVYALSNAPAGMTIDPSTGVVQWTPTVNQLGLRTFAVSMTDKAGNTRLQDFQITVREVAVGKFELRVVNQQGETVSQLDVGQTFNLQIWVQDIRASDALGVFSAYLDVTYDATLFETVGSTPISHGTVYTNTKSGSVTTAGLVDEVGGVSNSTANLDGQARLLAQVAMRTKAAGEANFSSNQADGVGKEFLLYGINEVIDPTQVEYGTRSILVGDSFSVVNDSFSVLEDSQSTSLDVLANDNVTAGQAGQLVVASVSAGSAGGQISVATDGKSVSYRPATNFNGVETFTYAARVGTGATKTATVSVTVQPVNDAPVANPDTFEVLQNAVDFIANVLQNDTTNGDTGENLRVLSTGTPSAGGQVKVAASGLHLLYTPKTGFTGNETVSYTITDGNNLNATSTVTFQVKANVSNPTAIADSFSMNEDEPAKELDVLANDLPSQTGETLTIISATATEGSVAINASGTRLIYTPKTNFHGVDVVTYTIRGSLGGTATGSATIAIADVNDGPIAVPDTFTVYASQASTLLDVVANDIQVDSGELLFVSSVTQPASGKGAVALSSDGKAVIYTPPGTDFAGQVTFTYVLSDGTDLKSTALVTLNVVSFVPRSIEGVVVSTLNPQADPLFYLGGQLMLQGVDTTNQAVQREGLVRDGLFAFADVAPGTYTIQPKALPFLSGAMPSLTVVSNQSDGDSKNNTLRVGSMDPRFLDIRDFLGTTINRGLTAAVMPGQSQAWVSGRGAWGAYKNVVVSLDAASTQVTIDAINPAGSQVRATLPANNAQVENRAQQDGFRLLRMPVEPSQLSFAPVPSTPQQTTPQGASVPNSSPSAPGEGEPALGTDSWLSSSGISQGNSSSAFSSPAQPTGGSNVVPSTSTTSNQALAWDYWLGNSADRMKNHAEERAKAADAALQSIGDDDLSPELGGWGQWIG